MSLLVLIPASRVEGAGPAMVMATTLSLLSTDSLRAAIYTYENDKSTQRGPMMQRDFYGNFYYYNYRRTLR